MKKLLSIWTLAAVTAVFGLVMQTPAQTSGQTAPEAGVAKAAKSSPYTSLLGEVTGIEAGGKQLTLKPDTGAAAVVALDEKTHFMKIAPGEKDLKKATDIALADVGVGDRVLARVKKMEDGSMAPASTVVVMTKAAIAQHQERAQAEWQSRGIVGTVTVVNPATKEVTLKTQGSEGKQVVLEPSEKAVVRKYAPGSVKFSDAQPSSLAQIQVGDTVRVLGTKNDDGSRVVPEEIVHGSFTRMAGTILAIDAAASTVKLTDLSTKKPVTVQVNAATTIKRLPEMMAAMMANAQRGGAPGEPPAGAGAGGPGARPGAGPGGAGPGGAGPGGAGQGGAAYGGPRSAGAGQAGGPAPGGAGPGAIPGGGAAGGMRSGPGGPGGRPFDPARALERVPAITLADLKAGDAVIVASSGGTDPSVISAISVVAGVEPLLTAPQKGGARSSGPNTSWNFEMSIPQ